MVESITKKVHITDEIFALIDKLQRTDPNCHIDLTIGNTFYTLEFEAIIKDTRNWQQDRDGQFDFTKGEISCEIDNLILYDIDGNEIRNTDWLIIDIEKINRNL